MKRLTITVAAFVLTLFATNAFAAMAGIYANKRQLIAAATAEYAQTNARTVVWLDGRVVYDSVEGFGPADLYCYRTTFVGLVAVGC